MLDIQRRALDKPDSLWRSCKDDSARLQGSPLRKEGDCLPDGKDLIPVER